MTTYSVLMSVYNREKAEYFRESIESMLSQTLATDDFVIVCDGALTPELDDVIRGYMRSWPNLFNIIRLGENSGLGIALNEGLKYCKNEFVARMDSDDISLPNRCEKQLKVMKEKQVDIVSGTVAEFVDDTSNIRANRVLPETEEEIIKFSKKRNPFNHPAVMFRKSRVDIVGGFKHFPYFEDYYLWVRMLENGNSGYNIQDTIVYMRAGEDMYARRGGLNYVKCICLFKWQLKKMGYTNWVQFIESTIPHVIVGIMPNGIRKIFYMKVLRKGNE